MKWLGDLLYSAVVLPGLPTLVVMGVVFLSGSGALETPRPSGSPTRRLPGDGARDPDAYPLARPGTRTPGGPGSRPRHRSAAARSGRAAPRGSPR
ncbi:hypothetical protein GCM10023079_25130 [Streptomyces chitinivorans]